MLDFGILQMLSQATIVVKCVLGLLVFMSLISWYIIIFKFFTLTSAKNKIARNVALFQDASELREAIRMMGQDTKSPAYQVAVEGVNELNRMEESGGGLTKRLPLVMDNLRRALRQGVSSQLSILSSSLSFLATCANAAPFIGLFGTVWGIMHSFHTIGQMKTAALAVVAPGISEALIATAIGLGVAIPATVAYNYFLGKIGQIESELVNFAGVFLNRVQRELPLMEQPQKVKKPQVGVRL